MEEGLRILTIVAGVLLSLGYYPQAYAMWKRKSAADVSWLTYAIFVIGTNIWLFYGFYHRDIVIISGFFMGAIGSWLVLLLKVYYTRVQLEDVKEGS